MAKTFAKGARVAWSHKVAPMHGSKSVLISGVVQSVDADSQLGTVVGPAGVANQWEVQLDDDDTTRILTGDELVNIEE